MELTHTFTVPVDRPTAWAAFQDIGSVAECFPGATVTSVEGDSFQGTVKVKLGPIALQYAGSGSFVERDAAAYRMVIEAKGRDKRGNGTAGADVTATFAEDGTSTRIEVLTSLTITGKPAQFGRGVIQDVSDRLLGQFLDCLEAKVTAPAAQPGTEPPAAAERELAAPAQPLSAEEVTEPVTEHDEVLGVAPTPGAAPSRGSDDALDLGSAVLPVLLRSYGKQAAGVLVVLVLLVRLLRRRGRGDD